MPHWDFPATEPIDMLVEVTAGTVRVTAEQTDSVSVDVRSTKSGRAGDDFADEVRVDFADGRLEVVEPSHPRGWLRFDGGLDVMITVPAGSHCWVSTASADITVVGELGSLDAKTISGKLAAGTITGTAELSTTSGRISLSEAAGQVSAKSASGSVELGHVGGDVAVNTVSGRIQIGKADANAAIRSASGLVKIGSLTRGHAEIGTVSGEVKVGVAKGVNVYLDMASVSGRVTSELEPADPADGDGVDLHLQCRSISGAVKVLRSEPAEVS